MIHYHGGPITPETAAYRAWRNRHAFISFAHPAQLKLAASICQSFALDNGAYSVWKRNLIPDWKGYYDFCEKWLQLPNCDFAIIPDVIGGDEKANDKLVRQFPFPERGVPVWHLNESKERLVRLAERWPRVALGSTSEYDASRPLSCVRRLYEVLPAICSNDGYPRVKLHGLRMLNPKILQFIPLASADSTNVARNIGLDTHWKGAYSPSTKELRATILVERIESAPVAQKLQIKETQ